MRRAVISFLNVTSGRYRWWDEFPLMIGERLRATGTDHVCFYRDYEASSPQPQSGRHPTPNDSLADTRWLIENVRPMAAAYDQVIFHTHGHYRPIAIWREVKRHRAARWFWTEHQISEPRRFDAMRKIARVIGQHAGRFPSRLFGVSDAGAARLAQQFRASSVSCIRTGIRIDPPIATESEPPRVPRRALFVGRLIPGKGIWPLLHAMVLLRKQGVDVHLTIVGKGMAEESDRFIKANDLGQHVTIAGHQIDVGPFYRDADFVVIPTLVREALGMVSLEARLHGLPVIYADRGGLPETQIDGVTGIKLHETTPETIAQAIQGLQEDPHRYASMRAAAPAGLESFSIEKMVDAYVTEYEQTFTGLSKNDGDTTAAASMLAR
jgi:glycosyltransferase involved in cell wall biosynthesis